MDKKLISFAIDEIENSKTLEEINESQFTKVRIKAFSTGITRHGYSFVEKVLKDAAFSILGKPILFKYDMWADDASAHEKDEVQCGFVPKDENDAEISFEYDEETGKTFLYVNAYIWAVYQEKLVSILKRDDGVKSVSVEMWLIEFIEHEKEKYTEVTKFVFNGITILGDNVTPACEGAKLDVVKFSYDDYQKAQNAFESKLNNLINHESDKDSFLIQKNSNNREVNMAKKLENSANETPEALENGEKIKTVNVNVSEYTDTYDDNGNYVSGSSEYHSKSETTVEKTDDNASEETSNHAIQENNSEELNNCEDEQKVDYAVMEEKCSALELKCSTLESELSVLKNDFSILELKCSTLEEYKTNKENESRNMVIECALNDVTGILSTDEITKWREKSLNCADVNSFINELKGFAFDVQKRTGNKPTETLRNSIPHEVDEVPANLWDRLAKTIN